MKRRFDYVPFSRANIYARDEHSCQYCGRRFPTSELTFDHVVPVAQGGRKDWENIVTCCVSCNRRKGGRTPEEAGMRLVRPPKRPHVGARHPDHDRTAQRARQLARLSLLERRAGRHVAPRAGLVDPQRRRPRPCRPVPAAVLRRASQTVRSVILLIDDLPSPCAARVCPPGPFRADGSSIEAGAAAVLASIPCPRCRFGADGGPADVRLVAAARRHRSVRGVEGGLVPVRVDGHDAPSATWTIGRHVRDRPPPGGQPRVRSRGKSLRDRTAARAGSGCRCRSSASAPAARARRSRPAS